jgi:hypothetical protein
MATAIGNPIARSAYALRYNVTADGTPSTDAKTQAQLIADCAEGPLKRFLQTLSTAQFNALSANLALTAEARPGPDSSSFGCTFSGGNMVVATEATTNGFLTLRYEHSLDR